MTDDEVYATIFNDGSGWVQFDRWLYKRRHDGVRYGAVLATYQPIHSNYRLEKRDNDRGLAALYDDKADRLRVIPAKRNGTGRFEYWGSVDIEVLNEKVLKDLEPIPGGRGPFWPLYLGQLLGEEPW
jgi:hypothetical protein